MDLDNIIDIVSDKAIFEINYFKNAKDTANSSLVFNLGEPELETNLARKSGDYAFRRFKKYLTDQEYFTSNIHFKSIIKIFGYWQLKHREKILVDGRNNKIKSKDVLNFILQGYKITNIRTMNDKSITIKFSNGMELIITGTGDTDSLFLFFFGDDVFSLCSRC